MPLQQGAASIVGGEFCELELPLLGPEAIRGQLEKGLSIYRKHLDARPTIFGRRRFGMTPVLPQILDHLRIHRRGTRHARRWPLPRGQHQPPALGRDRRHDGRSPVPRAGRRFACRRFPPHAARPVRRRRHGQSAHGDLRPLARQHESLVRRHPSGAALYDGAGLVAHAARLFRAYRHVGASNGAEGRRISFAVLEAGGGRRPARPHLALGAILPAADRRRGGASRSPPWPRWPAASLRSASTASWTISTARWRRPQAMVRWTSDWPTSSKTAAADFAQAIGAQAADATVGNARRGVPGRRQTPSVRNATEGVPYSPDTHPGNAQGHSGDPPSGKAPAGIVVTNPLGFSRRVCVDVSGLDCLPDVAGAVLRAGEEAGRKSVVVEVPPLGFVCVVPGSGQTAVKAGPATFRPLSQGAAPGRRWAPSTLGPGRLPMAELVASAGGAVLRNEFFELAIDPHTGAVRSVFDFHSRAPRLAQQVAMRLPGTADEEDAYSIMAADEIRVLAAGPVAGEVLVRGRLVDRDGQLLAGFQQSTARHVGQPRDRGGNPTRSPAATGRRPVEFVLCGSIRLGAGCADPLSQRESSDRCDRRRASGIAALRRDSRPRTRCATRRSSRRACPIIAVAACGNSIRC